MSKTLLLEIGTEEMPARFLLPALEQLRDLTEKLLDELRLTHGTVCTMGTPRRMAVFVSEVAEQQTPLVREVRGPAKQIAFDEAGNPTRAAEGFARAQGVAVHELVVKATDRGEFVFAVKREEGRPAVEVLSEALPQLIRSLSFPKTMRWEESGLRFGRPIRWLVALFGETVIPFEVAGVRSDRITYGRRFTEGYSGGKPIPLATADLYESALELAHVIVNPERRRTMIVDQVQEAARSVGGEVILSEDLLDEVTFLVEEPVALLGHFDERYLELPPEILITVMQHHQRYFPVCQHQGDAVRLLPYFVFVSNGMPQRADLVRQGNEKVVTARFEDARFYFSEDRKQRLEAFVPALRHIVFIEGLGTMADKTERLQRLVTEFWGGLSPTLLRAALLCKADLATRLVNEFTELQGVIGRIYALLDGEPPEVAEAIEDHYKPLPPDFQLPRNDLGWLLAVADRADTLCACFAHQLIPTGSHDPFGLRRAGTTLLLLLRTRRFDLTLDRVLTAALQVLDEAQMVPRNAEEVKEQLKEFLRERMEALLETEGIDYDLRRAVLAVGFDEVGATFARAHALQQLRRERPDWFHAKVTTFTRVTNILAQARQKGEVVLEEVDETLFEDAEKALWQATRDVAEAFSRCCRQQDFVAAFEALAQLAPVIDHFFDKVLVMHEDPSIRRNRLALLRQVERLLLVLGDFRQVQT